MRLKRLIDIVLTCGHLYIRAHGNYHYSSIMVTVEPGRPSPRRRWDGVEGLLGPGILIKGPRMEKEGVRSLFLFLILEFRAPPFSSEGREGLRSGKGC